MKDRTQHIKEIFFQLIETPAEHREDRLEIACAGDAELRGEVEGLLAAHSETQEFLERPLHMPARERIGLGEGDTVGAFELQRVLGEGGMGVVFLAQQDEPVRRQVALKIIKPGMDSTRVVSRFEAERQTLAMMSHAGIARVIDAGTTKGGYPYFAMEYVDGVSLSEWCDQEKPTLRERVELFSKVCSAVQHAHQKGVLHRDLKPSNLLTFEEDGKAAVKVIDFGVAKALIGAAPSDLTQVGMVIGTAEYMSPEQADQAEQEIDTRSDVYSLGVVLYEMLTGELPIDLRSGERVGFTEIRRRIIHERPRVASSLRPTLRGDLDWVLARCLEKRPEDRYGSVSELAADLDRFLRDEPVLAGPVSTVRELRRFVRRNRALVGAGLAVLLALCLGLAASLWQGNRALEAEAGLLRLSDRVRLERLLEEARALPFGSPEDEAPLRKLKEEFGELVTHLPLLQQRLDFLRAEWQELAKDAGSPRAVENTWERETLEGLTRDLGRLKSSDPSVSAMAATDLRGDWARAAGLGIHEDAWSLAAEAIAECSAYSGLELGPQVGLLPLEADPDSGLWEFWHPATGLEPMRGGDGRWEMTEETSLVFVLIPAGDFLMGARPPASLEGPGTPNVDPMASETEGPVHEVWIDEPFFLSKYEMTQGQWLRTAFVNPSEYGPSREEDTMSFDLRHPVDSVSQSECHRHLERLGLCLPTEAQWEYAARAGTGTAFFCGWSPASLEGHANLRDMSCRKTSMMNMFGTEMMPWDDGYPMHAPVGLLEPNPFGLHDVHGNLWEWVLESPVAYSLPTDPKDGRRLIPDEHRTGVLARGGSCVRLGRSARVSARAPAVVGSKTGENGVRPARAIKW